MKSYRCDGEGVARVALREVALLRQLKHANIVALLDVLSCPGYTTLVFEHVNPAKPLTRQHGANLSAFCNRNRDLLEPTTIKSFCFQICKGLEFCHANGIIHRELHTRHILVDANLTLKIGSFGKSRAYGAPLQNMTKEEIGNLWYKAPELLLGSPIYSLPVDMWSVGCIWVKMATSTAPFAGEAEIATLFKIFQQLGTPTVEDWPGVEDLPHFTPRFPKWQAQDWATFHNLEAQVGLKGIDLLEQLLLYDPRKRISARDALHHDYFADVQLQGSPSTDPSGQRS